MANAAIIVYYRKQEQAMPGSQCRPLSLAASGSAAAAQVESGTASGAQISARQRNRLARDARSGGGGGGAGGDSSCNGGKDGQEDGPPAFLGQGARGGMMDVASNAREALVSLAADLVAQVRKGGLEV